MPGGRFVYWMLQVDLLYHIKRPKLWSWTARSTNLGWKWLKEVIWAMASASMWHSSSSPAMVSVRLRLTLQWSVSQWQKKQTCKEKQQNFLCSSSGVWKIICKLQPMLESSMLLIHLWLSFLFYCTALHCSYVQAHLYRDEARKEFTSTSIPDK